MGYQERISRLSGSSSVCQSREITLNQLIVTFSRSVNFPQNLLLYLFEVTIFLNVLMFFYSLKDNKKVVRMSL